MDQDAKGIILKLQELLEQKKAALETIYNLTLDQQQDIGKNQGENLSSFIDGKQKEIEKIDSVDEKFNEAFEALKEELEIDSLDNIDIERYPQFRSIKKTTGEIIDLAGKIMALEEENKGRVSDMIDSLKKELKTVRLGQKSVKAYEKPDINISGVYIDRKK